jgi:hypothetical protein
LNGRLIIFMSPVDTAVKVGELIHIRVELNDASMPLPVGDEFSVRVIDEEQKEKRDKKKKKKKQEASGDKSDKEGGDEPKATHGLPPYQLLTKDGREIGGKETKRWSPDSNESDGGYASDLGDLGVMYYINYDNVYHLRYRTQQKGDLAREAVTDPDGHFKFPHLWPLQIPPVARTGACGLSL